MSSPSPERLARRRARERAIRRRRTGAAVVLAACAGLLAWLVLGGAGTRSTGAGRPASSARQRSAAVRVAVSVTGALPAPVQDAASAPDPRGGGVLLAGGLDGSEASVADVLRIAGAGASAIASLPSPLHDGCAATLGGAVYVFGGGEQTSFSGILRLAAGGSAEAVGSLPAPASDLACATLGGTVYLIGGYTGSEPLRTILAWRPGGRPRLVGTLPKPLRYAAVGVIGGRILIAGGTSGVQASRDVYAFDPAGGGVRELARLPHAVTHAAGASLGGALLVVGGRGEQPGSQRRGIVAITATGSVSSAGLLPRALSDLAAAASGGTVILAGGADRSGVPVAQILTLRLRG